MGPFSVYIFGKVASNVFEANFSMIDQENLCHISVINFNYFTAVLLPTITIMLLFRYYM